MSDKGLKMINVVKYFGVLFLCVILNTQSSFAQEKQPDPTASQREIEVFISVNFTTVNTGNNIRIDVDIDNKSGTTFSGGLLYYYISDDTTIEPSDELLNDDYQIISVNNGEVASKFRTVRMPNDEGTYWVGACYDWVGIGNDTFTCSDPRRILVYDERPDLKVNPLITSGGSLHSGYKYEVGSQITFETTVENVGDRRPYGTTVQLGYYIQEELIDGQGPEDSFATGSFFSHRLEPGDSIESLGRKTFSSEGLFSIVACFRDITKEIFVANNCSIPTQIVVEEPPIPEEPEPEGDDDDFLLMIVPSIISALKNGDLN